MSNDVDVNGDVESLQARLADRETLVTELTARLEQAAEQLDRLQRSGAGRNHVIGGGGVPAELVEEQRALTEELQAAVQQWAEMQPATMLAQIEMQVGEVRDLIVERLDGTAIAALAQTVAPAAQTPPLPAEENEDGEELSAYEMFKAGLADSEGEPENPSEQSDDDHTSSAQISTEDQEPEPAAAIPAIDAPAPIDFDEAGIEDLQSAVDQRDSYIGYLTSKLRVAETKARPSGNWAELADVPDELRQRLEELEQSLEESLRKHEVATSLERARLGREANRLELFDHTLKRRAKKLGVDVDDDSDEEQTEQAQEESAPKKRGWFGFRRKNTD